MVTQTAHAETPLSNELLAQRFRKIRTRSIALCSTLVCEDMVIQSMPDVSPTKWHLAHTTWFFEQFLLRRFVSEYRIFHERYDYLFNSYYQTVGKVYPRPERGLLTRPSLDLVFEYRAHVDRGVLALLSAEDSRNFLGAIELGIEHESFEEPAGVGEVPLRGARIGHRLRATILWAEWRTELLGRLADRAIALGNQLAHSSGLR